ncbi:hypothetical protein HMPREF3137_18790 [Achromobacter xylosoxidans]|nr:hypothetical protein HMPREF3137_18790 [Achromobacter xylosoxidans]
MGFVKQDLFEFAQQRPLGTAFHARCRTTGGPTILEVLASINMLRFISSKGIDCTQIIVSTLWPMSRTAALRQVARSSAIGLSLIRGGAHCVRRFTVPLSTRPYLSYI